MIRRGRPTSALLRSGSHERQPHPTACACCEKRGLREAALTPRIFGTDSVGRDGSLSHYERFSPINPVECLNTARARAINRSRRENQEMIMKMSKLLGALGAFTLAASPIMAHAADASSLSLAGAATAAQSETGEGADSSWIAIGVLGAVAVAVGVAIVLTNNDDDEEVPTSP